MPICLYRKMNLSQKTLYGYDPSMIFFRRASLPHIALPHGKLISHRWWHCHCYWWAAPLLTPLSAIFFKDNFHSCHSTLVAFFRTASHTNRANERPSDSQKVLYCAAASRPTSFQAIATRTPYLFQTSSFIWMEK